jgi:hypothetical protein
VLAEHVDELEANRIADRLRHGGHALCLLPLDTGVNDGIAAGLAG